MTLLPKNIFLDLDGTLLDSYPGLEFSVREAFDSEKLEIDLASLQSLIGPPIRLILEQLRPGSSPEELNHLETAFRRSYDSEGWKKTVCFPGAHEALQAARRAERTLYVVSNKPRHIAVKILDRERLLDSFDEIVTRDSRTPPYAGKTEMIRDLLQRLHLREDDAVMVGDTLEDAEAALQTGTRFILMTHGYGRLTAECMDPSWIRCSSFTEWLPMLAEERTA